VDSPSAGCRPGDYSGAGTTSQTSTSLFLDRLRKAGLVEGAFPSTDL
jgi:hypothetical protein